MDSGIQTRAFPSYTTAMLRAFLLQGGMDADKTARMLAEVHRRERLATAA